MFTCFKNQSYTYHDTRTHYLMEQDSLLFQDQAGVMDIVVGDMWTALKKRGAFGAMLKSSGSWHSMSRTCGPRDVISLVIPRLGDNRSCLAKKCRVH
jgi:hypothetical protein